VCSFVCSLSLSLSLSQNACALTSGAHVAVALGLLLSTEVLEASPLLLLSSVGLVGVREAASVAPLADALLPVVADATALGEGAASSSSSSSSSSEASGGAAEASSAHGRAANGGTAILTVAEPAVHSAAHALLPVVAHAAAAAAASASAASARGGPLLLAAALGALAGEVAGLAARVAVAFLESGHLDV